MRLLLTSLFCAFYLIGKAQINPSSLSGQRLNAISTAVPLLLIDDNAMSASMAGIGVVALDNEYQNAFLQNPAHLARGKKYIAGRGSLMPWLRPLVPGINIINAGIAFSPDGKNGFSYNITYNSLGEMFFTTPTGTPYAPFKPVEFVNVLRYGRALSEKLSLGVGYKFIYSDLVPGSLISGFQAGTSHAADLGIDYRTENVIMEDKKVRTNLGASILNLGQKISYYQGRSDFIPAVLRVGAMTTLFMSPDDYTLNSFSVAYQAQKLLVPTKPLRDSDGNIVQGMDPHVGVIPGVFQSFYDAPYGAREELQEIIHQFGLEARHYLKEIDLVLAFRSGYFHQHANKGNMQYITFGIGARFKGFGADLSYWIPTIQRHPLSNTVMVSLSYSIASAN
jgi:hypothetical protein